MDINKKIETAEEARQFAIDWQSWQSEKELSYGELNEWQDMFVGLANTYGLYDEFKENGII